MIGIIGAEAPEVELLHRQMTDARRETHIGRDFWIGALGGVPAVVALCGCGKVAAALCAQVMVDRFDVTTLINTGVAGGIHPDLRVGDTVVATRTVQYDYDLTMFDHPLGSERYPTDARLVDAFVRATARTGDRPALTGTVVSGDTFVERPEQKQMLAREFDAVAVEMEGAGIGQAATANAVPYVVIRAISDLADGTAFDSYEEFDARASEHSARCVLCALKLLADDGYFN